MFLAADDTRPLVALSWSTREGVRREQLALPFAGTADRSQITENLETFLVLGGTRLDTGSGDPSGLIVRVGFYKLDPDSMLLPDIHPLGTVRLSLRGVAFNQPARSKPATLVQHLTYSAGSLERCGAPGQLADIYLTANPTDDFAGRIRDERGLRAGYFTPSGDEPPTKAMPDERPGGPSARVLDGAGGRCWVRVNDDGTVDLDAEFPYAAFRHVASAFEPWQPGRFAEPDHFHIEFEVVPGG